MHLPMKLLYSSIADMATQVLSIAKETEDE
jgi:hypothetical protein